MKITIQRLNADMINDYLMFFETIAKVDTSECGSCHCMFFHTDERAKEWIIRTNEQNKHDAALKIKKGELSGFLAYDGTVPVAWCNVNERSSYKFNKSRFCCFNDDKKVVAIVCFYILKDYRGKGISKMLLKHSIDYYRSGGYAYVEAYPSVNKIQSSENYHGPLSLFLKNGFSIVKEMEEVDDFGEFEKYYIVRLFYQ